MPLHKQKTINDTINFQGVGLHNGINANLTVKPANENFGIKFCRTDVGKENLIEAKYQNVVEPVLCTKIKNRQISLARRQCIHFRGYASN